MYDVAVIGGGFVGYTASLGLSQLGLNVLVIESQKRAPQSFNQDDGRAIALAYTSCLLLKRLNVWPRLAPHACSIDTVHISEKGRFGKTRIRKNELNVPYLGHVIPAPRLGVALAEAVHDDPRITEMSGQSVTHFEFFDDRVEIQLDNESVTASWVLGADGQHSFCRQFIESPVKEKDYGEMALVANVSVSCDNQATAYERFTEEGTLALLPLTQRRMTSVVSVKNEALESWTSLSDEAYCARLQNLFGQRLGALSDLGKRFAYPLKSMHAQKTQHQRLLLLGNAVHTLSPIAAQGLNLALRDEALLFDALQVHPESIESAFEQYVEQAKAQHKAMFRVTDALLLSLAWKPFGFARSMGLLAMDNVPPLKQALARMMMGQSQHRGTWMQEDDHGV